MKIIPGWIVSVVDAFADFFDAYSRALHIINGTPYESEQKINEGVPQ